MTDRSAQLRRLATGAPVAAAIAFLIALLICAVLADVLVAPTSVAHEATLFSQLVHGARATVVVGAIATVLSLVGGVLIGAAAGFGGGTWDRSLSRMVEMLAAFPAVLMVAIVRSLATEPGLVLFGAAIAIVRVSEVARLVRLDVIRWQASEAALSARAIGATTRGILLRHVGPHLAPTLAQTAVSSMSAVIVIETLVEFLGMGSAPAPSTWGATLARSVSSGDNATTAAVLVASLATIGAAQILAERVREAFDPHARRATPCPPRG